MEPQAGHVAHLQGNYATAAQHFEESLALFRRLNDGAGVGEALGELAPLACEQGHLEQAEQLFEESLDQLSEFGDDSKVLKVLQGQSSLYFFAASTRNPGT